MPVVCNLVPVVCNLVSELCNLVSDAQILALDARSQSGACSLELEVEWLAALLSTHNSVSEKFK